MMKNLAAVAGGGALAVVLREVAVERRAPVLHCYLQRASGARAHFPVDYRAPVEAFEPIAARYPVFRITAADGGAGQ